MTKRKVPKRLERQLKADIAQYGKAYVARWLFGSYRIDPRHITELHPLYSPEAVASAKQTGELWKETGQ